MDMLAAEEAEQALLGRLGRLQRGEALELRTSISPDRVWLRQIGQAGHRDHGWAVLEEGPPH